MPVMGTGLSLVVGGCVPGRRVHPGRCHVIVVAVRAAGRARLCAAASACTAPVNLGAAITDKATRVLADLRWSGAVTAR